MNYKENPPQEQTEQEESTGCTAAEILVKCLEEEGVEYVFGIPGEENLDMMNALEKLKHPGYRCPPRTGCLIYG